MCRHTSCSMCRIARIARIASKGEGEGVAPPSAVRALTCPPRPVFANSPSKIMLAIWQNATNRPHATCTNCQNGPDVAVPKCHILDGPGPGLGVVAMPCTAVLDNVYDVCYNARVDNVEDG